VPSRLFSQWRWWYWCKTNSSLNTNYKCSVRDMTSSVTNASSVDVQAVCWPAWDDVLMIVHNQWRRSHRIIGGDIKEDWGSGGRKSPSSVRGGAPVGGLEDEVPQKLKLFCETTHNICIKIQHTTVAVTLADILNNITSKILGGTLPWMSPPPS